MFIAQIISAFFGRNSTTTTIVTTVTTILDMYKSNTLLFLTAEAGGSGTFLDSSTNNLTITASGTPGQGVVSPYYAPGYYSNYFNGSSYLSVSNNDVFNFGTGNFTVEFWLNATVWSAGPGIVGQKGSDSSPGWVIYKNTGSTFMNARLSGTSDYPSTQSPIAGQWQHWALVRSGTTLTWYCNGQSSGVYTNMSTNILDTAAPLYVGLAQTWSSYFNGYISNLRIVKGTAVYTAAFTPSTTALQNISGTVLLTCQSNRFVDTSVSNSTFAVTGTPQVNSFTPFAEIKTIVDTTVSGLKSVYFNGSTDYLTIPNTAALAFGTGAFTIECWINRTTSGGVPILFDFRGGSNNGSNPVFYFNNNYLSYTNDNTTGDNQIQTSSPITAASGWVHLAIVRSATTLTAYVNGVASGSTTYSTNVLGGNSLKIATRFTISSYFSGYISNLRIVKGTAVYTAAFIPPTTELTAIAGTSLLTCIGNNTFSDSSSNAFTITTTGTPQVKNFSPFDATPGAAATANTYNSTSFNGSTDYLTIPSNTALALSADFTVEMWVYPINWSGSSVSLTSGSTGSPQLGQYGGSANFGLASQGQSWIITDAALPAVLSWSHVALTRSGTTIKIFINGSQSGSTVSNATSFAAITTIGQISGAYFNGYISNLRIVKGQALYTANFTPSTTALTTTSQGVTASNVSLLTLQGNNQLLDSSTNALSITRTGSPSPQLVSPFAAASTIPGYYGSMLFNGSTDYLTIPTTAAFAFGTGDFTIESSVYFNSISATQQTLIGPWISGGYGFVVQLSTAGLLFAWATSPTVGTSYTGSYAFISGNWYHVAVTRQGTSLKLFVNGTQVGTTQTVTTSLTASVATYIGANADAGPQQYFNGYISNLRVVKGAAVYTAAFTPSTTPLTAISGTSLLTCAAATVVGVTTPQSIGAAVTTYGTPKFTAFGPFTTSTALALGAYGGSMYFNGSTDYLSAPNNAAFAFGTGDFTIEAWVYWITGGGENTLLCVDTTGAVNIFFNVSSNWGIGGRATAVHNYFGTPPTKNVWNHIAVSRSGSTIRAFINGAQVYSGSNSNNYPSGTTGIGGIPSASGNIFGGYISNLRIVKGTAVYTSNFIPPSTPVTAITNTSLLLNANNTELIDSTGNNDIVPSSPSTSMISTTVTKFGTKSIYCNGSTTYLKVPSNPALALGAGDFTVEFWMYPVLSYSGAWSGIMDSRTSGDGAGLVYLGYTTTANQIGWADNASFNVTASVTQNAWQHVAFVRRGTTLSVYINGSSASSATYSQSLTVPFTFIGSSFNSFRFNGYLDDIRISTVARYTKNFTPVNTSTNINDVYYSSTQLYLRGDAGTLTNTFADSSANAFALTKAGTPGQGTFTPAAVGYYSTYFDGSSVITTPSNAAFQLGTDNFTVEFWINASASGSWTQVVGCQNTGTDNGAWRIGNRYNSTNAVYFARGNGSGFDEFSRTVNVNDGAWHHVAAVRSSGNVGLYVDGVLQGATVSIPGTCTSTNDLRIGLTPRDGAYLTGYVSNIRIVKGIALYTSNFAPSTTPLTAISGTSLLTCYDGTAVVDQTPGATGTLAQTNFTVAGSPKATVWNPFTGRSFNPASMPGSYYFNGSTDYLTVPTSSVLQFGTGDFTVECWTYLISRITSQPAIFSNYNSYTAGSLCLFAGHSGGSTTKYQVSINGIAFPPLQSTGTIVYNAWTHLAVVRSGSTITLYINGIADGTYNSAASLNGVGTNWSIGTALDGIANGYINGYISNFRVVKGSALYSVLVPTTAPTVALTTAGDTYAANTVLLLNGNAETIPSGSSIADGSTNALTLTNTNVTISTSTPFSVTNYSTNSLYFDGTAQLISSAMPARLGTQSFTMELWLYPVATGGLIVDNRPSSTNGAYFTFNWSSTDLTLYYSGANKIVSTGNAPTRNAWNHVAYVRSGTTGTIYLNGVAVKTGTDSTNYVETTWKIGYAAFGTSKPNCYMSNFRVVLSAVYSSNFTPSGPLTAIANTALFVTTPPSASSFGVVDSSNSNTSLVAIGDTKVTTAAAKFGSGSIAFDGSGDGITVSSSTAFAFGSNNFTVEMWVYLNTIAPQYQVLVDPRTAEPSMTTYITLNYGVPTLRVSGVDTITGSVLSTGVWYHLAVCRISSETKMYINGSQVGGTYFDLNNYISSTTPKIGIAFDGTSNSLSGYIDDLRITKGVARYVSGRSFVPSSAVLTQTSQGATAATTSLLLTAQNSNLIDVTNKNNLTIIGNVTSSTSTVKAGATSMYFSGSSYAFVNGQPNHFSSGDFTVELWYYATSFATIMPLVDYNPIGARNAAYFTLWINATGQPYYFTIGATRITGTSTLLNTWNHVAVVRLGTSTKMYVNGVVQSTTYTDSNIYLSSANRPMIGGDSGAPGTYNFFGYIDDFRVSNVARYTSNFNPVTAADSGWLSTSTATITPSSTTLSAGSTVTFTITTTGVADGTPLKWSTSGSFTPNRFSDGASSGIMTIVNNTATVTKTIVSTPYEYFEYFGTTSLVFSLTSINNVAIGSTTVSVIDIMPNNGVPVDYLIVAGGGSGAGGEYCGGGGGAGGVLYKSSAIIISGKTYTVTVGAGGTGTTTQGTSGSNSIFGTLTAIGGGAGGSHPGKPQTGLTGGSGGGGSQAGGAGGAGTAGQGFAGGGLIYAAGGGGGGAGGPVITIGMTNAPYSYGTAPVSGGPGLQFSISGTPTYYGGGGGGGGRASYSVPQGIGGIGGGGNGGAATGTNNGFAGTSNTGGGGGGMGSNSEGSTASGGNGGSGIVVIRYADSTPAATSTTGSPTVTVSGGYRIYTWTSSGSITI